MKKNTKIYKVGLPVTSIGAHNSAFGGYNPTFPFISGHSEEPHNSIYN